MLFYLYLTYFPSLGTQFRLKPVSGILDIQIFGDTENLFENSAGLLGTFDEDKTNDLETRQVLTLPTDSSIRTIHYQFGETCKFLCQFIHQCITVI